MDETLMARVETMARQRKQRIESGGLQSLTHEEQDVIVMELLPQLLLALRAQYLAAGGSALKQWEVMSTRMKAACLQSKRLGSWWQNLLSGLGITAPTTDSSACFSDLLRTAELWNCERETIRSILREGALGISVAQESVKERRAAKEGKAEP